MTTDTSPFGQPGAEEDDVFELEDVDETNRSSFAVPEGTYKVKVIELEKSESKTGNPMWVWDYAIIEGEEEGKELRDYTALSPQAKWKIDAVVRALGLPIVGGKMKAKKADIIGKMCYVKVEDNEYNGTINSKITKHISLEDYEG